jgi:hypothetical protein
VAGANRIAAHLAQNLQPPFPHAFGHRSAHASGLVMNANSVQFDVLAIEQKPLIRVKDRFANAERG